MEIEVTHDVERFASLAEEFLAARIERNLMATLTEVVRTAGPLPTWGDPWFGLGFEPGTPNVVAAALRTPPRHLVSNGFNTAEAAERLITTWLEVDPEVTGVSAVPEEARLLVDAWKGLTGGMAELKFSEAMHELEVVIPPQHPPAGYLRRADLADLGLITTWFADFTTEAGLGDPGAAVHSARRAIDAARCYVWDDDGPVMMVGHATRVAGVNRIGPVYTPPEFRRRGYASAAVAALSQYLLDDGARRCMLFTDLANPTSNKIYSAVGYRRFASWEEHVFLTD
jgi:predicted GNAT family acetyltransferase